MEEVGYSEIYIRYVQKDIQWILAENETHDWRDYLDICKFYEQQSLCRSNCYGKRARLGLIMEFDLHGKYPDGRDSALIKKGAYSKLNPAYNYLVDRFCDIELGRGIEKSTVRVWRNESSCFLLHLQEADIHELKDVREDLVLSFFLTPDMRPARGSGYRWTIARFLKTCLPLGVEGCQKLLSFIPPMRRARKNVQYLTSEEHQKILNVLADMTNTLTLRDRAIGQIGVNYGMRSGDIAALEMGSIDLGCEVISITQRKTRQPLELPLLVVVGNAIYDYVVQERPASNSPTLFLNRTAPFGGITGEGVWRASESIMQIAGIRQEKGDRKGFHISRHHLVTALMGKGVPQPVISAIVGHADPNSLETYSYADHAHLKKCALGIERFPVSSEVFPYA